MNIEEFEALKQNPIEFVAGLAARVDEKPDFGLARVVSEFMAANPDAANSIPIVTSAGDLQQHPPGEFVRLRCCFNTPLYEEMVAYRIAHEDKFYTAVVPYPIPFEPTGFDKNTLVSRRIIGVSSVPSLTEWMRSAYASTPTEASVHLKVSTEEVEPVENLFDVPFSGVVKILFDLPDRPGLVYDFYGFFEEAAPFTPQIMKESSVFDNGPCFIALAYTPVNVLYDPRPGAVPAPAELRDKLMELLTTVLEPLQAEVLLLWLMGRCRSDKYASLPIGLISVNFTGCTPAQAAVISSLLAFLCTALNYVKVTCASMNETSLRPSVVNGEYKPTVLSAALNTRMVIDETELTEGTLTQQGRENFEILKEMVHTQAFDMFVEGALFPMRASYPTIILSGQSKSLIGATLTLPVGAVQPADLTMDPELLSVLRMYIEQVRTTEYHLPDETANFLSEQIDAVHKSDPSITQADLHLLMHLDELNCISVGQPTTNADLWQHTLELFRAIHTLAPNASSL